MSLQKRANRIRDEICKYKNVMQRSGMGFNSKRDGYILASIPDTIHDYALLYFLMYVSNTNRATAISSISSYRHSSPINDPMPSYYFAFVVIPAWSL